MVDVDWDNIEQVTPQEFAGIVKKASDKEINEVMAGPHRGAILDAVMGAFPQLFVADKAAGVDAQINFRVTGAADGGSDTCGVFIKDGTCTVAKDPETEPTVSLMMGPAEFAKLVTGQGNPVMMAMTGKLKVRGDLGLAQNFSKYFATPKA